MRRARSTSVTHSSGEAATVPIPQISAIAAAAVWSGSQIFTTLPASIRFADFTKVPLKALAFSSLKPLKVVAKAVP